MSLTLKAEALWIGGFVHYQLTNLAWRNYWGPEFDESIQLRRFSDAANRA